VGHVPSLDTPPGNFTSAEYVIFCSASPGENYGEEKQYESEEASPPASRI
jgi:hypothetical protein